MHYPVMLPEVIAAMDLKDSGLYVDATFGNGGYSEAFLNTKMCNVIGLDRDPNVHNRAEELQVKYSNRFSLIETKFSEMDRIDLPRVDAVVMDIGVSSMQIDRAERGFSFMRSGPLDMRMSTKGASAADAVNLLPYDDLVKIFRVYGEEKYSRRAAGAIISSRQTKYIETTADLASIIEKTLGRSGKIHPATRIFQALRIFINDELGELYKGLCAAERVLKPGGRLLVVTFHSLEDRIVKSFLRRRTGDTASVSRYAPEQKKVATERSFIDGKRSVIKPQKNEIKENPRSRSAKLRYAIRTDKIPLKADDRLLPDVIGLDQIGNYHE
ncbi:MAG: 16S rRNA (cytosine(1402)-N(4))-methyltransferase RsmH [Hellea sp.]|nr:16S rRNA (cytosine(1402)-N(4))-methyltransferase RsmH [Hellea sp.]